MLRNKSSQTKILRKSSTQKIPKKNQTKDINLRELRVADTWKIWELPTEENEDGEGLPGIVRSQITIWN